MYTFTRMNDLPLNASYWDERYQQQETTWDIGYVSTPIKEYIDQLTRKDMAILIPGCGNGYEAEYLLQQGFTNITLADISPLLTERLADKFKRYLNRQLKIITNDFFTLEGQYDLIIEQTFFCALSPSLREAYVAKMHSLLKPGGKLVGVLFNRAFEGGPPFGGNIQEYMDLFEPTFTLQTLASCYNSIKPRTGSEVFIIAQKDQA